MRKIKPGDIIKTPQGPRLVVYVCTDPITVRPLDEGMASAYPLERPPVVGAWTLLARGKWRAEPDTGWEHVK